MTRLTQAMSRESQVTCKQTQHCWRITLNIAECYMLRPFAHSFACRWVLLGFASSACTQLDTDATTRKIVGATMFGVVASVCTLL